MPPESETVAAPSTKQKNPVGPDGLTKHQRYRQRNKEAIKLRRKRTTASGIQDSIQSIVPAGVVPAASTSNEFSTTGEEDDIKSLMRSLQARFPRHSTQGSFDQEGEDQEDDEWNEWDRMQELQRIVRLWSSLWGGLLCWPMRLEDMFREVNRLGDEAIADWSMRIWEHADVGRLLLDEVELWTGRLPVEDERAMKILWKEFQGMHFLLIQGITIIETRVSVLNPGSFSVRPPSDRNLPIY